LLEGNRDLSVFRKKYDKIKPSLYPFTIHLGVNDRCIPEKMGIYVVVSDEKKSVENGNPCFWKRASREISCGHQMEREL